MNHSLRYRNYFIAGGFGALAMLVLLSVVFIIARNEVEAMSDISPGIWHIRVLDSKNNPVRNAEISIIDLSKWESWPCGVGNWTGRNSILTDNDGMATFILKDTYDEYDEYYGARYGGTKTSLFGYVLDDSIPIPALAVWANNRWNVGLHPKIRSRCYESFE